MFTKTAIALAIVLGTVTGTLAATKKNTPPRNVYVNVDRGAFDQRSSYSNDWSYWHRCDNMESAD
jgi:hypothetical protein